MKKLVFGLILILLIAGGTAGYFLLTDREAPRIAISPDVKASGPTRPLTVTVEDDGAGLKSVTVTVVQGDKRQVLVRRDLATPDKRLSETFTLEPAGLKDGPFELSVSATDRSIYHFGAGNVATLTRAMSLDTTPPRIDLLSQAHNIRQGGVGCVVYNLSEEPGETGVVVGQTLYPGFRQENGKYVCLFPFPVDMEVKDFQPKIKAMDLAGNEKAITFRFQSIPRKFKEDTLTISDAFLDAKMPQYLSDYPGETSMLRIYLKVNGEMRKKNAGVLKDLGAKTDPGLLWDKKAFTRLPNAAPRAGFGDRRIYTYQGKEIDRQTHMGVDLASLEGAAVPAANSGRIVYTGFFGIYGNCVIIDHGLGLQTLYSHLSQISVKTGDMVKKGDVIGNTGTTGLAGGDHLHFGVLVHGVEVSPVEWWDQHWINDNVTGKF